MCGCRMLPAEPPAAFPTSSPFSRASAGILENKLRYFPSHRVRVTRGNRLCLNQRVVMSPTQNSVGIGKKNLGWKRLMEQQNEKPGYDQPKDEAAGFLR